MVLLSQVMQKGSAVLGALLPRCPLPVGGVERSASCRSYLTLLEPFATAPEAHYLLFAI